MATKKTTKPKATGAKSQRTKNATGDKAEQKAKATKAKKSGALDAAAKVLGEAEKPMSTREMIEEMAAKGYWKSPSGKTPSATLYSAILRELNTKGKNARFKKVERGKFALNETRKDETAA